MQPSMPDKAHWSTTDSGLWHRWRGYTVRWLIFGGIVGLFQPVVDDSDRYWEQTLYQGLFGLLFGAVCAVVFTLSENRFNTPRVKWKSWLLVVSTWLAVKVVFVSTLAII
jgi:hypothetical protein